MESKVVAGVTDRVYPPSAIIKLVGEDYFTPFLTLFGDEFKHRFFTYKIFFRDSPSPMTTVKIIL